MPSNARAALDQSSKDIKRLLEIHGDIGGDAKGRRYGLEVLNKSAIVLITAFWEAYCEDIASEALDHLVDHAPSAASLPKELKKKLAADIKSDRNEIAMWDLADDGWKTRVRARLASLTAERNFNLNTPKADQIDKLFEDGIGLPRVSATWHWRRMSKSQARTKLDRYVTLRGSIAHRGSAGASVTKAAVKDYFQHVRRLAAKTGGEVKRHVRVVTGLDLW